MIWHSATIRLPLCAKILIEENIAVVSSARHIIQDHDLARPRTAGSFELGIQAVVIDHQEIYTGWVKFSQTSRYIGSIKVEYSVGAAGKRRRRLRGPGAASEATTPAGICQGIGKGQAAVNMTTADLAGSVGADECMLHISS